MTRQVSLKMRDRWGLLTLTVAAVLVAALFPLPAWGQATAAVNGTVRDSAGAVIPQAAVELHNRDTNLDRTAVTNDAGAYVMPDVQPGNYDLKVTKNGFGLTVKSGIILLVNQTATYDFALKAGSITQVVDVQANAVALETSTAELGVAVVKEQVNDLPLNGRNFTQILNLTPGVSTVNVSQNSATSGGIWSNPIGTFSYPSVNGQSNRSNLFLLDGVNNEGSFGGTYAIAPIVDDIQEFKVQTHNDDASFGGALGGVVNVVTKSGTSQFHGSGWEFLRNRALDANIVYPGLLVAEQTSSTFQPEFQQNQFGATFGGAASHSWRASEEDIFLPQLRGLSKACRRFEPILHTDRNAAGGQSHRNHRANLQSVQRATLPVHVRQPRACARQHSGPRRDALQPDPFHHD